jgi:hypothetical protein
MLSGENTIYMNDTQNDKKREIIASVAALLLIVIIVISAAATKPKKTSVQQIATKGNVQLSTTAAAPGSMFKNGTFKGSGSYDSPGGPENFYLTVTIKDDIITDTSATSGSQDITSREYQNQFIAAYKQMVVGKKISGLKLGALSGSSLTAQGFNAAIMKIEQEAV